MVDHSKTFRSDAKRGRLFPVVFGGAGFSSDLVSYVGTGIVVKFVSFVFAHRNKLAVLSSCAFGGEAAGEERSFKTSRLAVVVNGKIGKRQNAKYIFLENVY